MARKTREDYLREKEANARADLVRASRGGRDYRYRGGLGGLFRRRSVDAETERLAEEAAKAGPDWKPPMPIAMNAATYLLLALCLGFLVFIILRYGQV